MSERPEFKLAASEPLGRVPMNVVNELVGLKESAKAAGKDYTTAIEAQAKKFKMRKAALNRYITALAADTVDDLERETEDLAKQLALK